MLRVLFLLLMVINSTAFAQPEEAPKPVKVDEFARATNGNVKMRMDAFYVELNNNPGAQGYIINYGTDREIAVRERQIRASITWRKYDAARITFVRGGLCRKLMTEFWLVQPGAAEPLVCEKTEANPEVSISEAKIRRREGFQMFASNRNFPVNILEPEVSSTVALWCVPESAETTQESNNK